MIRKIANWSAEDDALVYDVGAAYKPSQKGGWTAKHMKEEAAAAALTGNPVADAREEADE